MPYEDRTTSAETVTAAKHPHIISMENRKKMSVSGVSEVLSFNERQVEMETTGGCLVISGEELSISRLSTEQGDVSVQGYISALQYEQPHVRASLWARLFR